MRSSALKLFRLKLKRGAALPKVVDAGEEKGIEIDRVSVSGKAWRHLAVDRLERVIGG